MNEVAVTRGQAHALEAAMRKVEGHVTELPTKHYFSPGIYAREMTIPAGYVAVGKIHKYPQLNILSKGEILVVTEEGTKHFTAPFTVVSPAGTKRAAYAITDCVWTTILHTNETDVEKIEAHFVAENETEYLAFERQNLLEHS